ncbi:MAG: adenosylmethionine--8-amino-7-oxononanoate transaminase [Kiritimatiellae bacterium]|nr:adenosylmethionine--8-amino-7-oxononanoate transaminase [Kiritimatiellia bacterium]
MTALEYDRSFIWHPYASLKDPPPVRHVKSAHGVNLVLADGRELVDAVSSWWCVAHGHNHPHIIEAMRRQSERLCHVMFGGFTHDPAIELAGRLAELAPRGLNRVFFADSGSISVEVAAKMAIQYHVSLGCPERCKLVALKGGYHGDTSLCMALSDPDGMHTLFRGIMTRHFFAEKPTGDVPGFARSLERVFAEHPGEIAAVICEPVFQAANAMNFYPPECLKEMRRICDENGALLVFDEIAAGFFRTGPLWAHLRSGVAPDIMTVGKALTGGHVTLAAAIASERVAGTISSGSPSAFMHGPTYMANPLACAAACASLDLFADADYAARVARIERLFKDSLSPLKGLRNIKDVRVLGASAVIEVEHLPARCDIERVIDSHGVWLRPFANFIYAMPPLVSGDATVLRIAEALSDLAKSEPGPAADGDFHE